MPTSIQAESYIFSSDPLNNPSYLSPEGDLFNVSLNEPIQIPKNSYDATIEVSSATLWNTVNNISANNNNNNLDIFYNGVLYNLPIRDGLYSVENLNSAVARDLVNLGLPANVVTIVGDDSTQLISLVFSTIGSYVDFTTSNNCRLILGYESAIYPVDGTTLINQSVTAPNIAGFNTIEKFLIKSTLVSSSIPTNAISDQTLVSIPIPAGSVGSQITYEPQHPLVISANDLKYGKQTFTNRLTDEKGKPAYTNEVWSFTVTIRYKVEIPPVTN